MSHYLKKTKRDSTHKRTINVLAPGGCWAEGRGGGGRDSVGTKFQPQAEYVLQVERCGIEGPV